MAGCRAKGGGVSWLGCVSCLVIHGCRGRGRAWRLWGLLTGDSCCGGKWLLRESVGVRSESDPLQISSYHALVCFFLPANKFGLDVGVVSKHARMAIHAIEKRCRGSCSGDDDGLGEACGPSLNLIGRQTHKQSRGEPSVSLLVKLRAKSRLGDSNPCP